MVEWTTALSRSVWQATQVRTPGSASRRFFGIGSPQSSHSSALSPGSPGAQDRVLHRIVDLVLNRAVESIRRPTPNRRRGRRLFQGFFSGAI
jgi:hypothetical protein